MGKGMTSCSIYLIQAALLSTCAISERIPGAAVYQDHCAVCHENYTQTHAAPPSKLQKMSPENILRALESGRMKDQGLLLTSTQRRSVAEYLANKPLAKGTMESEAGLCLGPEPEFALLPTDWNGWGADFANSRFQPADRAELTVAQVKKLKLRWTFDFRGTAIAWAQPTIVGGRVFVPSANGFVYSLDATSGCQYWRFKSDAPVRTAISIAQFPATPRKYMAFFGDQACNAYAIDATTGRLVWKTHVEAREGAKIVAGLQYYENRVLVPIATGDEDGIGNELECCSSRGAMAALDAATGKIVWKTYTIADDPHRTNTISNMQGWGPSGAGISSTPTIDIEHGAVYAGTGPNLSWPCTEMSNAVVAFELSSGKLLWSQQLVEAEAFKQICEEERFGDYQAQSFDITASPVLATLKNGKHILLVAQKSGIVYALDPEQRGKILWKTRVGRGGRFGGVNWGASCDGRLLYVALSEMKLVQSSPFRKAALDPLQGGGLFALDIETGAVVWASPPSSCNGRSSCSPAQSAAISSIPGVIFSGSVDGHLRAYSNRDGDVIWDFDTVREFLGTNGITGRGGSIDGPGPAIARGMLLVSSGYGTWGGLPGNVLLAFSVDGK